MAMFDIKSKDERQSDCSSLVRPPVLALDVKQSHFGADATYSLNHTVQGRGRYIQLRGQKSRAETERLQIDGSDKLTRMGGDYA